MSVANDKTTTRQIHHQHKERSLKPGELISGAWYSHSYAKGALKLAPMITNFVSHWLMLFSTPEQDIDKILQDLLHHQYKERCLADGAFTQCRGLKQKDNRNTTIQWKWNSLLGKDKKIKNREDKHCSTLFCLDVVLPLSGCSVVATLVWKASLKSSGSKDLVVVVVLHCSGVKTP